MDASLLSRALFKFIIGLLLVCALLFIPAGTLRWWQGWLLVAVLFLPMLSGGVFLLLKNPELLEKRLHAKERETEQREVLLFIGLMFAAAFIAAGLNYRFYWLPLPPTLCRFSALLILLAYALFGKVLRENAWLSRTVEVQDGQKVVDTGFYGVVRHPMYAATLLLFLPMPLVLGSLPSFAIMMCYPSLLVKRIENEEKILEEGLEGYADYMRRVKYRLIPFVW